jgi:ADP-heptose:LPS heptosyltransferase
MPVLSQEVLSEKLEKVSSILILGWGLLGDVFMRVPLIEAIRKRFPQARIVVVVDPASVVVLQNHPDCDEVIPFSRAKRPWQSYIASTVRNLVALRRRKFDLLINLYCGGSSARFSRIINAGIRLSFDHTAELRRANNVLAPCPSFSDNWTKALGSMLAPLGIEDSDIRRGTSFYCTSEAVEQAKSRLSGVSRPLAGFNLGAGAEEKRWPIERFVKFAWTIHDRYGITPLVFTNPGMEHLAVEFTRQYEAHGEAIVVPLVSLDEVGALMLECEYIVTTDTSLMHLAFGLRRPTLVLFTFTRPEMVAPEDVKFRYCFVESGSGEEYCGKPAGSIDISVEYALEQFGKLVASMHE